MDEAGELAVWNCHDGRCLFLCTIWGPQHRDEVPGTPTAFQSVQIMNFASWRDTPINWSSCDWPPLKLFKSLKWVAGWFPVGPAAGFLLQDDPNLLLDYLTLNFNSPARWKFNRSPIRSKIGNFISPACTDPPTDNSKRSIGPIFILSFANLFTCQPRTNCPRYKIETSLVDWFLRRLCPIFFGFRNRRGRICTCRFVAGLVENGKIGLFIMF